MVRRNDIFLAARLAARLKPCRDDTAWKLVVGRLQHRSGQDTAKAWFVHPDGLDRGRSRGGARISAQASTVVESVGHPHPLATSGCAESAWDCRRGNLPAQILGSCAIRKGLSVASLS
jgi:hypothetical protein